MNSKDSGNNKNQENNDDDGEREPTPEEEEVLRNIDAAKEAELTELLELSTDEQLSEYDSSVIFNNLVRGIRSSGFYALPDDFDENGEPIIRVRRARRYTDVQVSAGLMHLIDHLKDKNPDYDEDFDECFRMLNIPDNPSYSDILYMMKELAKDLAFKDFLFEDDIEKAAHKMTDHIMYTLQFAPDEQISTDAFRFQVTYYSDVLPEDYGPSAEAG